jgi:hypothetical protein
MSFKDKIVIVDLAEKDIGRENTTLLGALILTQLYIDGVNGLKTHLYVDDAADFEPILLKLLKLLPGCPNISVHLSLNHVTKLVDMLPL